MQNTSHSSDAIDLFELCSILWKRKLTIIAITSISIIFAAIYAFTAKEKWTSKAQIIQPNAVQLGDFLEVQQWYSRFTSDREVSIDASPEAMQKGHLRFISGDSVNVDEFLINAYRTMIVMLSATDNKLDYLQDSDYFKQQTMEVDNDSEKQKMLVAMSINNLQIEETEKNKRDSFDVSFTAETASDAQKTLQKYIANTNKLVLNRLFEDLRLQINEHIRTLENEASNIKQQMEQGRKNQVMLLKQAILAAKDANIAEYTGESTVAGNTIIDFSNSSSMFLLGEKYLTAQLQALESSPIIYPVNLYQTLENINGLKQLLNYEPKGGIAYQYTKSPSFPLIKDEPKKIVILFVGMIFGGIISFLYIIICAVLNNKRNKKIEN